MKLLFRTFFISIFLTLLSFYSFSQVHVKGYYRKNGTYVQPHVRSSPDGNIYNNYSYPGNYNPYTEKTAPGNEGSYYNGSNTTNSTSSYKDSRSSSAPDKISIGSNGSYALKYSGESKVTRYYLFNSNGSKYGKVFFFDDGDMCTYDLSNNLLKRTKNTSIDKYNSSSNATKYQSNSYNSQTNDGVVRSSSEIKMKFGNDGDYALEYSTEPEVTRFHLYHSNNVIYGKVYFFEDGDMCVYDLSGKLLSNTKYK